jgi:diguanylate cyclase (GGDEF)-like protein/PAS domain S-box-containing protein
MLGIDIAAAISRTSCAVMLCDLTSPSPKITYVNAAFTTLSGYSAEEAVGRSPRLMQGSGSDEGVMADVGRAILAGTPISREFLAYRKDGAPFWNRVTILPIPGASGESVGFVAIGLDSTAEHDTIEVETPQLRVHKILANMPGFIYRQVLKPDGGFEVIYLSRSASQFLGDVATLGPSHFLQRVHPDDLETFMLGVRASARSLSPFKAEFRLTSSAGLVRWVRSESEPVRHANGDIVWDGMALDITAEKASDLERAYLRVHDKLTGLANRELFRSRLRQAIERTAVAESTIGVFCLDLDDFQDINDSHGEAAGDEVLRQIARRLTAFADGARGSVARLGGDEFAVVLPTSDRPGAVEANAQALCQLVLAPVTVDTLDLVVRGSVGVAVFPTCDPLVGADICEELMKQADLALHAAKREEPGGFRSYHAGLDDRLRNRVALRQSLTQAIAEQQFELHYQPVVMLESGAIVGAEALVRWDHPTLGLQRPEAFIPLAESSGLIVPLGEWIVRQAFRQGTAWRRLGFESGRVAINLSSVQLRRGLHMQRRDFLGVVEAALKETGADPNGFEFELTESTLIESPEDTLVILKALKSIGFSIAIDDFGTGHASFRYLRDLVFDKVKIDRSFVSRIGEDSDSEAIVSAMIRLPRMLGAKVVGEGVETAIQRDFLYEEGCEFGQGYLFSTPVQAEDFGWMLAQGLTLPVAYPGLGVTSADHGEASAA